MDQTNGLGVLLRFLGRDRAPQRMPVRPSCLSCPHGFPISPHVHFGLKLRHSTPVSRLRLSGAVWVLARGPFVVGIAPAHRLYQKHARQKGASPTSPWVVPPATSTTLVVSRNQNAGNWSPQWRGCAQTARRRCFIGTMVWFFHFYNNFGGNGVASLALPFSVNFVFLKPRCMRASFRPKEKRRPPWPRTQQ